jgi:tRNA pseudouridine38-40 synthase
VRRIDLLTVRRPRAALVVVAVEGKAFCHQMVRSVTGCLLAVGRGSKPPEWVADVLAARERGAVGQVAPPHGLTLVGVGYR